MNCKLTWLGQAGFILKTDNGSMAIDPYCGTPPDGSRRLYESIVPKQGIKVDFAISSHSHYDHFDIDTYRDYVLPKTIMGPKSCMKMLQASDLKNSVNGIELDVGDCVEQNGFKVTAVYANHDRDSIGAIVECGGITVYFSGDTLFDMRLFRIKKFEPDVVCICINGKLGNMNYFEAATYCDILRPKVAIPMHYDLIEHNTENPQNFVKSLNGINKDIKSFIPEKGVEYDVHELLNKK